MRIGFAGCGNMATAMIKGILDKGVVGADSVFATSATKETRERKSAELGIGFCNSNRELAEKSDILFLAVKPNLYEDVINEIRDVLTEEKILVAMTPGKTIEWLREKAGESVKIIRIMPNTPAAVCEAMTSVTPAANVSEEELEKVTNILNSFGKTAVVKEPLIDAVIAVSGSSPAYVFMIIEAMADAAVMEGLPRKDAYTFAAQAVLGSAKMVLELGKHPGELKDMVCSPGGTTIEAVAKLEEKGLRSALIEAMRVCVDKSGKM